MSLNVALQGKTYHRVPFRVDEERVRAFAAAIGHPGRGVPPTFVTVPELAAGMDHLVADPDLGLDLARVLHGEETYEWRRPIRVGETIIAESTIERIRTKGSLQLLTIRTLMLDEEGEVVVEARSTLISREDD